MPHCTVCTHPQRRAVDGALLADNATYAALSQQYGLNISALCRHKKPLQEKICQARQRLRDNLQQGCLFKLNNFLAQIQTAAQTAVNEGNVEAVLKAARVGTRIIHSLTKMAGPLDLATVYRLMASPQWTSQDSLLPTDPQILTDSHQALAADLFFPCPEPLPDWNDDDDDDEEEDVENDDADADWAEEAELPETSHLNRRNSELATPPSLLRQPLPGLVQPPAETEKCLLKQRQKSAKLPRNYRKNTPFRGI